MKSYYVTIIILIAVIIILFVVLLLLGIYIWQRRKKIDEISPSSDEVPFLSLDARVQKVEDEWVDAFKQSEDLITVLTDDLKESKDRLDYLKHSKGLII